MEKAVDEVSKTAENQVIIAEIRKTDRLIDHPNRFYTYADRLKGTPNPKDSGLSIRKKQPSILRSKILLWRTLREPSSSGYRHLP